MRKPYKLLLACVGMYLVASACVSPKPERHLLPGGRADLLVVFRPRLDLDAQNDFLQRYLVVGDLTKDFKMRPGVWTTCTRDTCRLQWRGF